MAKAGYEPSESIKLWERMAASHDGKTPPEILSTHPSDVSRQEELKKSLPVSEKLYEAAPEKHGTGEPI
jgi:predicted Zn-dependent protease